MKGDGLKKVQLSVGDENYLVFSLTGEESFCRPWNFDCTIQVPHGEWGANWLLQSAVLSFIGAHQTRFFAGEITAMESVVETGEGYFLKVTLQSPLHRLAKSGGARHFKDMSFAEVVREFSQSHEFLDKVPLQFLGGVGQDKVPTLQQLSGETDAQWIDRHCATNRWCWGLFSEQLVFFDPLQIIPKTPLAPLLKKGGNPVLSAPLLKKGGNPVPLAPLLNPVSSRVHEYDLLIGDNALATQETGFFLYREHYQQSQDAVQVLLGSLSAWISLGDRCSIPHKPLLKERVVVSIQHHYEPLLKNKPKTWQYRNQLCLSQWQSSPRPEHAVAPSAPFQLGFVKSKGPYASVQQDNYAIHVLSDSASHANESTHPMRPVLGYGGVLSKESGLPVGFQALWYDKAEVLLAEINRDPNHLAIAGALPNHDAPNSVTKHDHPQYRWQTPGNTQLRFDDDPAESTILWCTENAQQGLQMGKSKANEHRVKLSAATGAMEVKAGDAIVLKATQSARARVQEAKCHSADKAVSVSCKQGKIHYQTHAKAMVEAQERMQIKSQHLHWKSTESLLFKSKTVHLQGEMLWIQSFTAGCQVEADTMVINGRGGQVDIGHNKGKTYCRLSASGKITIGGAHLLFTANSIFKGKVESNAKIPQLPEIHQHDNVPLLNEVPLLNNAVQPNRVIDQLNLRLWDPFNRKKKTEITKQWHCDADRHFWQLGKE